MLISALLASLFASPNITTVKAGTTNYYLIELSDGTNVTTSVESSLSWNTQKNNVTVSFHLSVFGENSSYVIFELITFKIITSEENSTYSSVLSNYPYINTSEPNFSHEVELNTPESADNLKIEIAIRMTNSSFLSALGSSYFQTHIILFPQDGSISVDREQIFPLIDLYGFPERSAFLSWFLVYFIVLTFMSTPALVLGGKRINSFRIRRKMK